MYKTDCVFKLKLSSGRTVNLMMMGEQQVYAVSQPGGSIKHYVSMPVGKVYHMLQDAWSMAGISIVSITNHLIGDKRFWYSEKYDLTVMLQAIFQRDRPDLGGGIDEHHEHAWYCNMSKSIDQLNEEYELFDYGLNGRTFTDDFEEALVAGLHEHGFQFNTPESSYSPTGQMYCRYSAQVWNKRLVVRNMWTRDV